MPLNNKGRLPEYIIEKAEDTAPEFKKQFDCGNKYINERLIENEGHNGVVYVWMDENRNEVIAYASIKCSGLVHDKGNEKFQIYPAIQIDCFAVDLKYQNYFLKIDNERLLLSDDILKYLIYNIIYAISDKYCYAEFVILLAVPGSVNFYKRNEFKEYENYFVAPSALETQGCVPMYYVL